MKATELIESSLECTKNWAMGLISTMRENPMQQPTPKGGNHPLWVLGHIVHSESQLLDVHILGKENRFPELAEKFAMGSEPSTNADQYPSFDELMEKFDFMRAATLAHLATLSDEDLGKSTCTSEDTPQEVLDFIGTVGACFNAMSAHMNYHAGQIADSRRAAGLKPLMS